MKNTLVYTEDNRLDKTLIDFTENGNNKGMQAKEFFDLLDKINSKDK